MSHLTNMVRNPGRALLQLQARGRGCAPHNLAAVDRCSEWQWSSILWAEQALAQRSAPMIRYKNPLTMWGELSRCWLVYQTPPAAVQALLPPQFELLTYAGQTFWNLVVSEIRARPWPLPALAGVNYRHAAYRLYVRFHPAQGAPIEGLYFVRSECDLHLMCWLGNRITDFNFHYAPITIDQTHASTTLGIHGAAPGFAVLDQQQPATLRADSVFERLETAANWLKYQPAGLAPLDQKRANVVHITRNEAAWRSRLVTIKHSHWPFLEPYKVQPELCYAIEPLFYRWNRGRIYD